MIVCFLRMKNIFNILLVLGLCTVIHVPECRRDILPAPPCLQGAWIEYVPCVGAPARLRSDSIDTNPIQSVRGIDLEFNKSRYNTRKFLRSVWAL